MGKWYFMGHPSVNTKQPKIHQHCPIVLNRKILKIFSEERYTSSNKRAEEITLLEALCWF